MNGIRFLLDVRELQRNLIDGIILTLTNCDQENYTFADVCCSGPADTPYAGGTFTFSLRTPADFPASAPKVEMRTQVWHPNISRDGKVWMNILSLWSPVRTLFDIVESLVALLRCPNPASPLNGDAAYMCLNDYEMFTSTAAMWTSVFANGPAPLIECYEEKVHIVELLLGCSKERALKELSVRRWSMEDFARRAMEDF